MVNLGFLYNAICRRTSTYAVGIVASVFFFERGFDLASDAIFDNYNKGVSWPQQSLMYYVIPKYFLFSIFLRNCGKTSNINTSKK